AGQAPLAAYRHRAARSALDLEVAPEPVPSSGPVYGPGTWVACGVSFLSVDVEPMNASQCQRLSDARKVYRRLWPVGNNLRMTYVVGGCVTTPLALPTPDTAPGWRGSLADWPASETAVDALASNRRFFFSAPA